MKTIKALALLLILASCNPGRKIQRAEQIVRTTPESFNTIGKQWSFLNPCANDTIAIIYPGGIDSIAYPVPVFDSAAYYKTVDSLQALYAKECNQAIDQAYALGYKRAVNEIAAQKLPVKRADTLASYIVDARKHLVYEDSIMNLRMENARIKQQNADYAAANVKEYEEKYKFIWLFIAAMAALMLTNGLWIFNKIKKF